jgi:hypothetical protein
MTAVVQRGARRWRYTLPLALALVVLGVVGGAQHARAADGPFVNVTQPAGGSTISGVISVAADASSDVGIDRVVFQYYDGASQTFHDLGTDTTPPYATCFDTTKVPDTDGLNGTVYATAYDTNGASTREGSGVAVSNGEASNPGTTSGDSLQPCNLSMSLGVGSSKTTHATVHFDAAPAKADILLALDTTGSMGSAITDAQNDASNIVNDIKASIPGAKFAIVDFKDYPTDPFGNTGDYPWRVDQDFTDNSGTVSCQLGVDTVDLSPVACALAKLTANSGNDEPEAYNRAFFETYDDTAHLTFTSGAPRFMVVLGDSIPHDTNLHADFPSCPSTADTDPGSAFTVPSGPSYAAVGALHSLTTLTALKQHNTNLSFVTYNPHSISDATGSYPVADCHAALAAYTGGSEVVHGNTDSLENQIVSLINQAASHIDQVTFTATPVSAPEGATWDPSSWVSFDPPLPYGPISAPADLSFDEIVTVPQNATLGTYQFDVHALADGNERAVQHVTVTVGNSAVSSLSLTADEPSIPAGIASVPYGSIPGNRLAALTTDANSTAAGSIAAGSIAAGSIASGSIAAGSIASGSIAAGSIASGSIAAGSIAAGSIGLGVSASGSIAAGSIPSGGAALKSVLLSQIPLVGTTWVAILKGSPFANQPLQAVTLYDVANYAVRDPSDNMTPWERLMALPLKQVPFFQTLWRSVPFGAILLGNANLDQLPRPLTKRTDDPPDTRYANWGDALTDNGGSTSGVTTSTNTVFGLAVAGDLGTTAVGSIAAGSIASGSIAAGSIAAGSIAAGSIAAGSIDLRATTLGSVPLTAVNPLADIVNCGGGFNCNGKTLGDASAANAIKAGVTLAVLLNHLSPPNDTITIDSLAQGILAVSEYPWEQINVQGLQDVAGTGQNVHYHVNFDLVCSQATSFSVHVKLPDGFFPMAGSSKFTYGTDAPLAAAEPNSTSNGPVWGKIPGSPCGGGTATRHVRLDFTSYPGLTLGSQSSDVDVTAVGGTPQSASNQAPVVVTQNWEPSENPATAPTIGKNTLIVGHIAAADDLDFYRFHLTGLAPGTKVITYLKVPRDADLDLVVNKPGAPGVQTSASGSIAAGSIAAGSIAAGSIPIEDTPPGADSSRLALQPDTVDDLASGSIASGSIAAGSISANRGAVNEVAQIVTRGETGDAVIGISGYNSAFSASPYVLRVKVVAPPTLPPCDPVTGLGTAAPGTLPLVPANPVESVKTLFLVNRQRLAGLYGQTGPNSADSLLGASSPLYTLASRPEVGGVVLPMDGDSAVRSAYSAWDQNPCSIDAANTVVRSINNVVANYRPKYPNLKYVVLLGTDTALPMWRQYDLTATSPEVDEATDLAFTTTDTSKTPNQALAKGNAIYAAAAQNAFLTDGAYGAFKERTWLGHDIPLPDVSVSRLVETPDDILGQLNQYLDPLVDGRLDLHSALTTGDSFFSDGAKTASDSLGTQLPGLLQATLLTPTDQWTHQELLNNFFQKSPVPDVGALWAHYSHWTAQPAKLSSPVPVASDFATTADADPSHRNGQLLFTVGCHSALNIPDSIATVAAADQQRKLDWAEAYLRSKTAVYLGNTGFGYGETTTTDLSERLMDHFAADINSGGTIGEQWVRALHQYYSEPSNYDVIDEKVMLEANMYGLPFYGFTGTPQNPPPPLTDPSHPVDPATGLVTAQLPLIQPTIQQNPLSGLFIDSGHPDGTTYTQNGATLTAGTLSVFYRPIQPTVSRDVTINDPQKMAHGAWIRSLTTETMANVTPVKSYPLVHSTDDRPALDFPNIYFPANIVTVNPDFVFGKEQDTAVVNLGKFFPNETGDLSKGTEQVVDSIGVDIGYSSSPDVGPPKITQVGAVKTGPGTFTAFVRVTDDGSGLNRVAVLFNTGSPAWGVQALTKVPGSVDLWTATITTASTVSSIRLDAEAQDNAANVGTSFNKAVNFQSTTDTTGPTITLDRPLPNAVFTLNNQVSSSFFCSDPGGVASCVGKSDTDAMPLPSGNPIATGTLGPHTFTVTATDLGGKTTTKTVTYYVLGIFGFKPPVDNPPVLNIVNSGNTIPVKWTLKDANGNFYRSLSSVTSVSSKAIKCTPTATDPDPDVVASGLAGLKYDLANEQFVYNWPTQKSWKGTCRRLIIGLVGNGVLPYADFQFK